MIYWALFGFQQIQLVLCEIANLRIFAEQTLPTEQSAASGKRLDQRGLARPVNAKQADPVTGSEMQVNVVEHRALLIAVVPQHRIRQTQQVLRLFLRLDEVKTKR